jgi:hypothetical protein
MKHAETQVSYKIRAMLAMSETETGIYAKRMKSRFENLISCVILISTGSFPCHQHFSQGA